MDRSFGVAGCLGLLLEQMLVQNILHENDLFFKRMNVQATFIFIQIVLHKDSFYHRGMSWLREPLI